MTNLWWVGKTIVSSFLDILQEVDDTVCFTNTWNIHSWSWSSKLKSKVKNELKTIGSNLICEWQCAPSLAEVQILAVHLSMVLRVLLKAPVLWWWDLKRATSTQITSVTTIQWSRSTNTLLQCTHLEYCMDDTDELQRLQSQQQSKHSKDIYFVEANWPTLFQKTFTEGSL